MKNVSDKKFNIGAYILRPYARSEEHIRDIKNAHIDFMVSMDCHRPTLDLFEKYGIGAIVCDVLPHWWGGEGENSGKMSKTHNLSEYENAISGFVPHKAIWGIDMGDEISSKDFDHLKNICIALKGKMGDAFLYTNLYPNYGVYASTAQNQIKKQLGCESYREYIQKYCETVPLDYICFDHYLYSTKDFSLFLENLRIVSDESKKYSKSPWFIAQISSSDKSVTLGENNLRVQAFCAMAFGISTIMWACYTGGWWHNHALNEKGNTTTVYDALKKVNSEILFLAKEYTEYECVKTHIPEEEISSLLPSFKNINAKNCLVSQMKKFNHSDDALFVAPVENFNEEHPQNAKICFCCQKENIQVLCTSENFSKRFDSERNLWTVEIPPYHGALIMSTSN